MKISEKMISGIALLLTKTIDEHKEKDVVEKSHLYLIVCN